MTRIEKKKNLEKEEVKMKEISPSLFYEACLVKLRVLGVCANVLMCS